MRNWLDVRCSGVVMLKKLCRQESRAGGEVTRGKEGEKGFAESVGGGLGGAG